MLPLHRTDYRRYTIRNGRLMVELSWDSFLWPYRTLTNRPPAEDCGHHTIVIWKDVAKIRLMPVFWIEWDSTGCQYY